MIERFRKTYREFPSDFWILVLSAFIDRIGGTLIFPFFALYITGKFGVGMTQAGILLGLWSIAELFGSMAGGALTDNIGRKSMALFGLVVSALASVSMGLIDEFSMFYGLAIFAGLFASVGYPARQAMVADLLPEEQRAEGFGILRVAANLAWIIGPTIGGFLAQYSFLLLFLLDAVSSLITAVIFYRRIPETKPEPSEDEEDEGIFKTLSGYLVVAADKPFLAFIFASMLMSLVYLQLYSTLSVFLRDVHGMPAQVFGSLMSLNATTVVIFQFWVTKRVKKYPGLLMMGLGTGFYLVGFLMYGFVAGYPLFLIAMLLITIGEMIIMPVGQELVARFAPEEMRGRYMAFFGLTWMLPSIVGPGAAGLILDNYNPRWVWYASGILCALSIFGFLALYAGTRERFEAEKSQISLEASQ